MYELPLPHFPILLQRQLKICVLAIRRNVIFELPPATFPILLQRQLKICVLGGT
jgi:hypothetical protein